MIFKRTTKYNPEKLPAKHHKVWLSAKPHRYRIVWRNKVFGINVDKGYQVLVEVTTSKGETIWTFADMGKRLVRTLKRSQEIAERHNQIWERAVLTPGIRSLMRLFGGRLPYSIPTWIKLDPTIENRILRPEPIKYSDEDDDSEVELVPELPPESKTAVDDPEFNTEGAETGRFQAPEKKRGRPKGSKNKPKEAPKEAPKRRGRPPGSKNKPKT